MALARRPARLALVGLLGLVLLVLATPGGPGGSAYAGGSDLEMVLVITEGGVCDGNDCYADLGSSFRLGVELSNPPADGYYAMQTFLDYGDYDPTASEDGAGPNTCSDGLNNGTDRRRDAGDDDCTSGPFIFELASLSDEVVWPDSAVEVRFSGAGWLTHGGLTAFTMPWPASAHEGLVIEIQFKCNASATAGEIALLEYGHPLTFSTVGTALKSVDFTTIVVPKVNTITMHCGMQAEPGDSDGDGCSDVAESGSNPALGGDRDWLNPWDFYDVDGPDGIPDGKTDLFNDIVGVIDHIGSAPGPPYDIQYDRGPWINTNSWNGTLPPDGTIDLFNDVVGVIAQYSHACS